MTTKKKSLYPVQTPWENRWEQPTLEQLIAGIEDPRRETFQSVIAGLESYDFFEANITWGGDGWKWTYELSIPGVHTPGPLEPNAFIYIVFDPREEPYRPQIYLPLSDELIAKLPFKKLNRYIRDGIKGSKLANEIVWTQWSPGAQTEVEHLMDLCKRKIAHLKGMTDTKGVKPSRRF